MLISVYLEDEDDDDDEEDEAEAEAVPEPKLDPEAKPDPEPEAKPDPEPEAKPDPGPEANLRQNPPIPVSKPEPEAPKPGGVWAALNPVNWFKQPEVQKMKDSADKKDRPKQATVVCEVCGKSVSGDGAWQMHIEGAYHRKALLRKERGKRLERSYNHQIRRARARERRRNSAFPPALRAARTTRPRRT